MPNELNPSESYASEQCAVCGERKRANSAFCPTDFSALTWWQRKPLQAGPADPAFAQAFQSALQHLRMNSTRTRLYPVRRGEWPYRCDDDLRAAGYRRCEQDSYCFCRAPKCHQRILWFWTPQLTKIAVQFDTLQPHRTSCVDPDFFARKKSTRASRPGKQCRA